MAILQMFEIANMFCSSLIHAKTLQLCLTLCDPMNWSPPGSSVHGILQAKILEWVAMPSSRESSQLRYRTQYLRLLHWQVGSLPLAPPGRLKFYQSKIIYLFLSGDSHISQCLLNTKLRCLLNSCS